MSNLCVLWNTDLVSKLHRSNNNDDNDNDDDDNSQLVHWSAPELGTFCVISALCRTAVALNTEINLFV